MSEIVNSQIFSARTFTDDDQREFVRMSGDANPIHADAIAAAKTFAGGIIVHGVHGLMWSLDAYLRQNPDFQIQSLQANFLKPIRLNQEVVASAQRISEGLKLTLTCAGVEVTTAKIMSGVAPRPEGGDFSGVGHAASRQIKIDELAGVSGQLVMAEAARELAQKFPALAAAVGSIVIAGLGSLATLVGMECPGLYGVSTGVAVAIATDGGPLTYKVTRVDRRFYHAQIEVRGYGLTGTVSAFINQPRA